MNKQDIQSVNDNKKGGEQLLEILGDIKECYIQEYIDAQPKKAGHRQGRMRLTLVPATAIVLLLCTVSLAAAVPVIGHFYTNLMHEQRTIIQNFDQIEAEYGLLINDTQECDGVVGTLNSAVLEDRHLVLSYTFDWSGLEEAQDGSFHSYFLPWFFYITEGDLEICRSEYTIGLHTQIYMGSEDEDTMAGTYVYCIDLNDIDGEALIGKELTVRLLYAEGAEGFSSSFSPISCFTGKNFPIGKTYEFGEHIIQLDSVQESALYVTFFMDCATIGHPDDYYDFILSDELGNDYTLYPNDDNEVTGCWFTRPRTIGTQLTLKVIHSRRKFAAPGEPTDDSYDVLYEIPIELKAGS